MIPQCEPAILNANPQFKALYRHVAGSLLNPDGSTRRRDPSQVEALAELRKRQVHATKRLILTRVLAHLVHSNDDTSGNKLPDEFRELVLVTALYLQLPRLNRGQVTTRGGDRSAPAASGANNPGIDDDEIFLLLSSDIEAFLSYIPTITPYISNVLASELGRLKVLANAASVTSGIMPFAGTSNTGRNESATPREFYSRRQHDLTRQPPKLLPKRHQRTTSTAHNSIPSLSVHLSKRLETLRETQLTTIPIAQQQVAETAARVLAAQTQVMERTIHILERTKHGVLARAEKARAEHLAKVAEAMEGKIRLMRRDVLSAIYTPETCATLDRYSEHLHETRLRLERRQQGLLRDLAAYEETETTSVEKDHLSQKKQDAPVPPMTQLARKYGRLAADVEAVRLEIARLGG